MMEALIQSELLVASFSSLAFIISFSVGGYVAFKETVDLRRRRKAARLIYDEKFQKIMAEAKQIAIEKIRIKAIMEQEISEEKEAHDEIHNSPSLITTPV